MFEFEGYSLDLIWGLCTIYQFGQ